MKIKLFIFALMLTIFAFGCKTTTYRPDGYVACKGFNPPSQKNLKTAQTKRAKFEKRCQ